MAISLDIIKGEVKPLHDRLMVSDMEFGEVISNGGIILPSDDGQQHGIKPRWAKIVSIGHENTDDYNVGDWILIQHGRWTRGIDLEDGSGEKTIRMVEAESILAYQEEKPNDVYIGAEHSDGPVDIDPQSFINR